MSKICFEVRNALIMKSLIIAKIHEQILSYLWQKLAYISFECIAQSMLVSSTGLKISFQMIRRDYNSNIDLVFT